MNYYTSDMHLGHWNIVKYCGRPFASTQEMTETLIRNWNSVVKPEDTVYDLGDFSFYNPTRSAEILKSLNGTKILIRGNHDKSKAKMLAMGFSEVHNSLELDGWLLVHHPPVLIHPMQKALCGHVHQAWRRRGNVYNVGVDVRNFTPVTLDQILEDEAWEGSPYLAPHEVDE